MAAKRKPVRDWIQTASGRKMHPLAPHPDEICIEDIAHHLAHISRYTGATRRFYSVAQHSVLVSYRAGDLAAQAGLSRAYYAKWGLLHDASEAYLVDVARPVKHQPVMRGYRAAEKRLQAVIVEHFDLNPYEPLWVRQADAPDILSTEARDLMSPLDPDWIAEMAGGYRPLPFRIRAWSPRRARAAFMRRYVELFDPRGASLWVQFKAWIKTYLSY